jgi:3-hydroxyisobutyrate dehydrogenase-like beta-hydroxyacid dehydrogenase
MGLPKIGFIGLGIMGKPMARNLMKAGYPLVVHNRSRGKVDELAREGATPASSSKEVAAAADVIITMLPNSPDVELVVLGANGVKEGAKRGQLLIDMSTINPIVSQKIAQELSSVGVAMVDAPVSGGEKGAIDAALSIMAGGEPQDFERALPIFNALGKTITHMGPARLRRLYQARQSNHRCDQSDRHRRGAGFWNKSRRRSSKDDSRVIGRPCGQQVPGSESRKNLER